MTKKAYTSTIKLPFCCPHDFPFDTHKSRPHNNESTTAMEEAVNVDPEGDIVLVCACDDGDETRYAH